MNHIKFGTDGWRAVIGDKFTFKNLKIVTQAVSRWIADEEVTVNGVVIGHDARFSGRLFTEHVASVFASMGIPVRMADTIAPTPAISWAAKHFDAVGIVITASHNPPEYNGFKIKAPFGGPATPEQVSDVEERFNLYDSDLKPKPYNSLLKAGVIREVNITDQYLDFIRDSIDLDAIQKSGILIGHNPMFGSGQKLIKKLLDRSVLEFHSEFNPSFRGIPPEPIEKNLVQFSEFIPRYNCDIGIANDGDADRISLFDENGTFVDSHRILSLLVKYLNREKKLSGKIIKTFSTTNMLDKQADKYGIPIDVTPIGFKYIAEKIIREDVLVGGEESGGIAVKGHIPERDGIYIGLLITEMMVKSGKKLSELVQELFDEFGPHSYYRNDLNTLEEKKNGMMKYCKAEKLTEIAGQRVVKREFLDGVKHHLESGAWLMVRPSGTEPVLRIYSEASSETEAKTLVDDATKWVDNPEILK